MPEKNSLSRMEKAYTLKDAEDHNQLIRIRCHYCRITRNYLPKDLIQLLGVVPVHLLTSRLHCDKCHHRDYLRADTQSYSGADLGKLPLRRLVRVSFVPQVTWEDGLL